MIKSRREALARRARNELTRQKLNDFYHYWRKALRKPVGRCYRCHHLTIHGLFCSNWCRWRHRLSCIARENLRSCYVGVDQEGAAF